MKPYKDYVPIAGWELDFSNPPKEPPTCSYDHCKAVVPAESVIVKEYHLAHSTEVAYFCSADCHHSWYIKRINQMGL